ERTADGWIVRDSGSRNGTLVNGIAIAGPTRLRHGDRIGLGSEGPVIEFRLAASSASRRALALAFGMVVLPYSLQAWRPASSRTRGASALPGSASVRNCSIASTASSTPASAPS